MRHSFLEEKSPGRFLIHKAAAFNKSEPLNRVKVLSSRPPNERSHSDDFSADGRRFRTNLTQRRGDAEIIL